MADLTALTGAQCVSLTRSWMQDEDPDALNLGVPTATLLLILNEANLDVWNALNRAQYEGAIVTMAALLVDDDKFRFTTITGLKEILSLEWNPSTTAGKQRGTPIEVLPLSKILALYATSSASDTTPLYAAITPLEEGSGAFELYLYPPVNPAASKKIGGWVRNFPSAIANDATVVDLPVDASYHLPKIAACRAMPLLGEDDDAIQKIARQLPEELQALAWQQSRHVKPRVPQTAPAPAVG